MAVNVFLTFQTKLDVDIRKLEKWYLAGCYLIPGIPALVYLLSDSIGHTDYYGNATVSLWKPTWQDNS
jgi:hypothetical protein